jgi:hypothetical protein
VSLLSEVKTILTIGGVSTTKIRIGKMPSAPDSVIVLYNSGGYARQMTGTMVEQPTFQVRVRNADYEAAVTDCNTVKDLLHAQSTASILMIEQQGDIQDLGPDQNGRPEFTLNFRCYYRRT